MCLRFMYFSNLCSKYASVLCFDALNLLKGSLGVGFLRSVLRLFRYETIMSDEFLNEIHLNSVCV